MSDPLRIVLAILATWRVAHLIAREDGPFDIVVRVRARAGHGVVGRLMDCPYCLSLWVAAPWAFWIARDPVEWIAVWLAVSGGASLLERVSSTAESREPEAESREPEAGSREPRAGSLKGSVWPAVEDVVHSYPTRHRCRARHRLEPLPRRRAGR